MQFHPTTLLLLLVLFLASLAVFGTGGILVFLVLIVAAVAVVKSWWPLFWSLVGLSLMTLLLVTAIPDGRPAVRRILCNCRLKQVALALHEYAKLHGCFPPAYIADTNGRPMHSWRVLILPQLGYDSLFKRYSFDEPWDGPNNRKLLSACPEVYVCPSERRNCPSNKTQTSYVAMVGSNAAWSGSKPRRIADLAPLDKTVMLAEVTNSGIGWTEPRDLLVESYERTDDSTANPTISSQHRNRTNFFYTYRLGVGANIAVADASVRYITPERLAPEAFEKCLQIGGYNADLFQSDAPVTSPPSEKPEFNWPNCAALAVWVLSVISILFQAIQARKRLIAQSEAALLSRYTASETPMASDERPTSQR
jgi:hypothetical protein